MSKLFVKVDSDIRSGVGCKGEDRIKAVVSHSLTGERKSDGYVSVVAEHKGGRVQMTVSAKGSDGHNVHVGTVTFSREGVVVE